MATNKLRILHTLARSGSTLVGKCLGSMKDIILLSEIHPVQRERYDIFNPLIQAYHWHNLIDKKDIPPFEQYDFQDAIELVDDCCKKIGKTLVIRDWNQLDFMGSSRWGKPTNRFSSTTALSHVFSIIEVSLVRHPIDQWLSFQNYKPLRDCFSIDRFLSCYYNYAKECSNTEIIRYEDFTSDPDGSLIRLTNILEIPYDPGYKEEWFKYAKITGDVGSDSRGAPCSTIKHFPHREIPSQIYIQFTSNEDYHRSLELFGYTDR